MKITSSQLKRVTSNFTGVQERLKSLAKQIFYQASKSKQILAQTEMPAVREENDKLDLLKIIDMREDPNLSEDCLLLEQRKAKDNAETAALLQSIFLTSDREADFQRFLETRDFAVTLKILKFFGITKENVLCEIGGGSGFFTWAMMKSGFTGIDLLEPNSHWITGTGYLRSRSDSLTTNIYNDLKKWHSEAPLYDALITKNCIHHFQNITLAGVTLRQKLKTGGLWFSFREWFADTPKELAEAMTQHPYSQPYGLYEWPYPAAHYAEAIELSGFKLKAVIPEGYENNCLGTYSELLPSPDDKVSPNIDKALAHYPEVTLSSFGEEVAKVRAGDFSMRLYTRPQAMIFEKVPCL